MAELGGAFRPNADYNTTGQWDFEKAPTIGSGNTVVGTTATQTLTNKTLTTPVIDGVTYGATDRQLRCAVYALSGAALHAAVVAAFTAPAACIIERVIMDITTASTGACTLDVGYTAVSATTTSDTLLDGIDVGTAIGFWDSMNAALDSGANALAQKAASGKWITVAEKTGDATGLVGNLYIYYTLV
jgi:hypothetical protein